MATQKLLAKWHGTLLESYFFNYLNSYLMNFIQRLSKNGDKITFYYDYGRGPGQRPSTGVFIYAKPNNQIQKNHNKEALKLLEIKKSQVIIEQQAIGSSYIASHKFKENFIDYFDEYIKLNKRDGNRHLTCCFSKFKEFIDHTSFIAPLEISENFCKRFRRYLLDKLTMKHPQTTLPGLNGLLMRPPQMDIF